MIKHAVPVHRVALPCLSQHRGESPGEDMNVTPRGCAARRLATHCPPNHRRLWRKGDTRMLTRQFPAMKRQGIAPQGYAAHATAKAPSGVDDND